MYLFYRVFFCANKMTLDNRCWILETFVATSSNIPYGDLLFSILTDDRF